MNRALLAIPGLLVLLALPVGAQQGGNAAARIEAAKTRAAQANIPVQLIESKIAEGRAKGVPEERIAAAVERRAAALARAQEAMGRSGRKVSREELAAGADAVEAGVDATALRSVIEEAQAGDGPVALAVLTELKRQGMPVDRAVAAVTDAMRRGGNALASLPAQAAAARERRGPPAGIGGQGGAGRAGTAGSAGAPTAGPPAGVPAGQGGRGGRPSGTPRGRP